MGPLSFLNVLKKTSWRIAGEGGAAEVLGLKRTTLQSLMKRLGIDVGPPVSAEMMALLTISRRATCFSRPYRPRSSFQSKDCNFKTVT